jgi:hypothetical protein
MLKNLCICISVSLHCASLLYDQMTLTHHSLVLPSETPDSPNLNCVLTVLQSSTDLTNIYWVSLLYLV